MLSKVLITPVDTLVEFVKARESTKISEIQSHLNLPIPTIERWLVILEEYKVISVDYKGFEGIVKFEEKDNKKKEIDLDHLRDLFIEKAKAKSYSYDKMRELWPIFLIEYKPEINKIFFEKAKAKGFNLTKTQIAWKKFETALEKF